MRRYSLLLLFLLSISPTNPARGQTETVFFGPDAPATPRPQFVAEADLLTLTPLTGDPALSLKLGVFVPSLRTTFYAGGTTPHGLSELATESLFASGEDLDVFWDGEVQIGARVHLSGRRYTGFYVEAGLGYEAFEVRPRGTDRDDAQDAGQTNTVENFFAGVGPGYAVHLFGGVLTVGVGGRAVFLFGGPEDETAGGAPIEYNWGFVTPEVRLGIRL